MPLNTSAVLVSKAQQQRQMIYKKQSTTLKMNYSTNLGSQTLMQQAEDFRQAYGIPSSQDQTKTQKSLIDEEWSEFHQAFHFEEAEAQLKELADLVYVCYQYAANEDWDLDEALNRVHKSNMSKLDEYGKPVLRGDGKVLKGPFYEPPNLSDLV